MANVLVVYTGGTIGSIHLDPYDPLSPLVPGKWEQIQSLPVVSEAFHDLQRTEHIDVSTEEFDPTLDSSNMSPADWIRIAEVIYKRYNDYDGFVILHGTDTMTYTAAALSFIFLNLSKPIILTGSTLPISFIRTDAIQNLVTSVKIAAGEYLSPPLPLVPEVCIFFNNKLIRGNRARKINVGGYDLFDSPNYPLLGEAGEYIIVNQKRVRPRPPAGFHLSLNRSLEERVMSLDIFPGIQSTGVMQAVMKTEELKGLSMNPWNTVVYASVASADA